jgi:hypothetical protein
MSPGVEMNERIKELLAQAGYDARYCSEYFDPKIFAELLVNACADVCYNEEYMSGPDYGDKILKTFRS